MLLQKPRSEARSAETRHASCQTVARPGRTEQSEGRREVRPDITAVQARAPNIYGAPSSARSRCDVRNLLTSSVIG